MKKLGKLSINPEKVLCNEDLRLLRGGYDSSGFFTPGCPFVCHIYLDGEYVFSGQSCGASLITVQQACNDYWTSPYYCLCW
jgi:hypothetical protein